MQYKCEGMRHKSTVNDRGLGIFSEPSVLRCEAVFRQRGYVPLNEIYSVASELSPEAGIEDTAQRLMLAFNGARPTQVAIAEATKEGDPEAAMLGALLRARGFTHGFCWRIQRNQAQDMEAELIANTPEFISKLGAAWPYPCLTEHECLAFDGEWAKATLLRSEQRMGRFRAERRSDTAVLVGNGPSLAQIDYRLLQGQEVFISNYALREAQIHRLARGVAVTNRFVAAQEPHLFRTTPLWRFHPLWLADIVGDSGETVYLNALGGDLFFSEDVTQKVAWHSTVTFFWLQILYSAGYRKVCLIGVDNAYTQHEGAREGELIEQVDEDENHFDKSYFRGKVWQAADTERMAQTYRLARRHFEADGREIVNCTAGGRLEVFRRASLADELRKPHASNASG